MVLKVGGQSQVAVDGGGHCVSPHSERSRARGNGERGIACGPRIELGNTGQTKYGHRRSGDSCSQKL